MVDELFAGDLSTADLELSPGGWTSVPFDVAIKTSRVKVGKVNQTDYLESGTFPVVDQGQRDVAGWWDDSADIYAGELPVIIFGDHTRIFKFIDRPFVAGADGVKILVPNYDLFDPHFLYFAFLNLQVPSRGYNRHFNLLREQVICRPPIAEQRAIAHILSTVQQAKESTEAIISVTRELKKSLVRHLLTYGSVTVADADRVPLIQTEIGLVPEDWRLVRLGELIADGPQNGLYKPQTLYGTGTPIIRIDDYDNEGGVVTNARNRVSLTDDEVEKYRVRTGDLLINRVNSLSHLGKVALIGDLAEPVVFESNMMRFSVDNQQVDPEFVFRCLASPRTREQIRGMAKRAVAQSSINQGDVSSLLIALPPLAEQRRIASALAVVDQKVAVETSRQRVLGIAFASLLHHLMTGKVRVADLNSAALAAGGD